MRADKAFKTLMATVTTQWEDAKAFERLSAYRHGGGHVRLVEAPPEDFVTPDEVREMPFEMHY